MQLVFVTGATGFVGRGVVPALRAEGYVVRCLVRHGSEGRLKGFGAVERVEGDVLDRRSLEEGMTGCHAVVHLVGIIEEHPTRGVTFENVHALGTQNVVEAAGAAGVRRFVHMSALGARPGARSRYHRTKWAAEEAVRSSGMSWTIFRPSIIYGRRDEFVTMLARMVRWMPLVPVIGAGRNCLQPVPVEHVAEGFARALATSVTEKHMYDVVGPESVTMLELLDLIGSALGRRRVRKLHVPLGLVRPLARAFHSLPGFPVTPDQLLMLEEDNVGDPAPFYAALGIEPTPLATGLARLLS